MPCLRCQSAASSSVQDRESEYPWLLNSQETGKNVCLERIHQLMSKERKFIVIDILQTPVTDKRWRSHVPFNNQN